MEKRKEDYKVELRRKLDKVKEMEDIILNFSKIQEEVLNKHKPVDQFVNIDYSAIREAYEYLSNEEHKGKLKNRFASPYSSMSDFSSSDASYLQKKFDSNQVKATLLEDLLKSNCLRIAADMVHDKICVYFMDFQKNKASLLASNIDLYKKEGSDFQVFSLLGDESRKDLKYFGNFSNPTSRVVSSVRLNDFNYDPKKIYPS